MFLEDYGRGQGFDIATCLCHSAAVAKPGSALCKVLSLRVCVCFLRITVEVRASTSPHVYVTVRLWLSQGALSVKYFHYMCVCVFLEDYGRGQGFDITTCLCHSAAVAKPGSALCKVLSLRVCVCFLEITVEVRASTSPHVYVTVRLWLSQGALSVKYFHYMCVCVFLEDYGRGQGFDITTCLCHSADVAKPGSALCKVLSLHVCVCVS